MTRLFLAAGVAALAISAPAVAKPGGGHGGGKGGQAAAVQQQGGGGGHARGGGNVGFSGGGGHGRGGGGGAVAFMGGGGGRGHGGGGFAVQRQSHGGGGAMRMERSQRLAFDRGHGGGRGKANVQRVNRQERIQARGHVQRGKVRAAERQQIRQNRFAGRNNARVENRGMGRNIRENRMAAQNRFARPQELRNNQQFRNNQELRNNRVISVREANNRLINGFGVGGCPPGLMSKGCMPPGQALQANRIANDAFRTSALAALTFGDRTRLLSPFEASRFVGVPLSTLGGAVPLMALPSNVAYLYPDTPDYYYRYGDGYLYQVDRGSSLVNALLPLLGGGFLPGSYLPNYYMSSPYYGMNSYFPSAYGFNSFYPDYGNNCYRYGNGVIYEVDCFTGLVENVIPMYAGGYGVGQLLPSSYGYYNVPYQYRSMYYNTPDYNYWYAPGAIYQYDPGSSMITSVAALLSPGFTIGQPLPLGYNAYNVPYAYRSTYYDTPNAWYRYNNGYIYQVDPMTQLVTAIVASILT
jgi:hypothetical protein